MRRSRTPWFRGALTLGVLAMFGAGMLVSNVGAVAEKREASKKFVKKRINKAKSQILSQIPQVGNPIFIEEDELVRYGPVDLTEGQTETVATIDSLSFIASCELDDDADPATDPDPTLAEVQIDTSTDDVAYESDDSSNDDYDAADPAEDEEWASNTGDDPPTTQDINSEDDQDAHAVTPAGLHVVGGTTILTDVAGDAGDCRFFGWFIVNGTA